MALGVRYERDGLVLPRAIGGDPALDLVNTLAGWDRPSAPAREYLASYDHLVQWSASVGMVAEDEVGPLRRAGRRNDASAADVLQRVKQLRASVHDLLQEPSASDEALSTVHHLASGALASARLRWQPPAMLDFAGGVQRPLDALAWHCLLFLGTTAATQVRACPGQDCGWLFVDRTGRRRWCRMEWCGNRAKVRAHARRRREPT
jgi:predicted RNA-binding Zn ribbon-like protein